MTSPIYRIYDTIEKRHRTSMFVDMEGKVREYIQKNHHFDGNGKETLTYTAVRVEDQSRYIVERGMDEIDKNGLGICQNDIVVDGEWNGRKRVFFVGYGDGKFFLVGDNDGFAIEWGNVEIIGHRFIDSHLLEQ